MAVKFRACTDSSLPMLGVRTCHSEAGGSFSNIGAVDSNTVRPYLTVDLKGIDIHVGGRPYREYRPICLNMRLPNKDEISVQIMQAQSADQAAIAEALLEARSKPPKTFEE